MAEAPGSKCQHQQVLLAQSNLHHPPHPPLTPTALSGRLTNNVKPGKTLMFKAGRTVLVSQSDNAWAQRDDRASTACCMVGASRYCSLGLQGCNHLQHLLLEAIDSSLTVDSHPKPAEQWQDLLVNNEITKACAMIMTSKA